MTVAARMEVLREEATDAGALSDGAVGSGLVGWQFLAATLGLVAIVGSECGVNRAASPGY